MSNLKYRWHHQLIADTNIHVVDKCKEHDLNLPHSHYTHRRWLEWIDILSWHLQQYKLKKLLKHNELNNGIWEANWSATPTRKGKAKL